MTLFLSTNIDDLFILMAFWSDVKYKKQDVILGQYFGIFVLTLIGCIGLVFRIFLPIKIIGLLGIIPVLIGISKYINNQEKETEKTALNSKFALPQWVLISSVTIANGSDNISVYVPVFATLDFVKLCILIITFILMTLGWLAISYFIINNRLVQKRIRYFEKYVFPLIFIILGISIIIKSESYKLITDLFDGIILGFWQIKS
jgi:cadmium resistance protein CadD (predicted permease)